MKKYIFQSISKIFLILLILTLLNTWQIKKDVKAVLVGNKTVTTTNYDDFHLLIPKINVDAPIIADVDGANKEIYFKALENGVAQFKGSSKPGEGSNIFIFGHSSFYAQKPGNYKKVFKELEKVSIDDEIIIWYQKKEYKYKITKIKVVQPEEVDVLKPTKTEQVTLMTCVPPGTTLKRLIIIAKPDF